MSLAMAAPLGHRDNPAPRRAARVLLVDRDDRVLMFRGSDPATPGTSWWFTVGGGLDDGETSQQAAARELREETGLDLPAAELGEPVWHDVTEFSFNGYWYRQQQQFFLVRVQTWDVSVDGHDEIERDSIHAYHWWSADELVATTEEYYPPRLPHLLREILGS